jgi:hypothetical protein
MIELPITDVELRKIIELLKNSGDTNKDLYAKLWTFNFNRKK